MAVPTGLTGLPTSRLAAQRIASTAWWTVAPTVCRTVASAVVERRRWATRCITADHHCWQASFEGSIRRGERRTADRPLSLKGTSMPQAELRLRPYCDHMNTCRRLRGLAAGFLTASTSTAALAAAALAGRPQPSVEPDSQIAGSWNTRGLEVRRRRRAAAQEIEGRQPWRSACDGKTLTNARQLGIEHIVSLAEAWDSGTRSGPRTAARLTPTTSAHRAGAPRGKPRSNRSKGEVPDRPTSPWCGFWGVSGRARAASGSTAPAGPRPYAEANSTFVPRRLTGRAYGPAPDRTERCHRRCADGGRAAGAHPSGRYWRLSMPSARAGRGRPSSALAYGALRFAGARPS